MAIAAVMTAEVNFCALERGVGDVEILVALFPIVVWREGWVNWHKSQRMKQLASI